MSLVALALPQDLPRMKIMAEKSALSPSGETPAVYVEPVPVLSKKDKKDKTKHKKKAAARTLVHASATASIPIALSSDANSLIHSAPSSPEFLKPKRGRGGMKLRTRSKGANSDPEVSSTSVSPSPSPSPVSSPSRRPLFLPFLFGGGKGKSRSREVLNGPKTSSSRPESPNVVDRFGSGSSIEPEATPATTLPGERQSKLEERNSGGEIPTIYISHEHNGCSVELEVDVVPDESRKMSQTSVGSTLNSANSGYCTLSAAGSGDEGGSFSDLDYPSPVSPSSMTSSPGGSVPNIALISINTAASSAAKKTSTYGSRRGSSALSPDSEPEYPNSEDAQSPVATPTTPLSAPLTMSVSPLPGPRGVSPPTEGGLAKSPVRIRDPLKKRGPWEKVRKFVQALSPFTLQFNKKKYAWVQLAGHQDSFCPGEKAGSIQKKSDLNESSALKALSTDILSSFVPEYIQTVTKDGQLFVEMSDLLREFTDPAVMDIKMGVRTYLEDELEKARTKKILRQDMYKKMIDIDPSEPTPEEHAQQAITKPRYMQWRETISSSSSLGFRIEGIKTSEGKALKDFKTTRHEEDVKLALRDFVSENPCVKEPFLKRLRDIRSTLEKSEFFRTHEVIGSSLLFVYDSTDLCSVHLIDFGKTVPLSEEDTAIDHRSPWVEGNHEDGYLWGLDNLIRLWSHIRPEDYASPVKHRASYGRSNSAMAL